MSAITEVLKNTNWKLLAEMKAELLACAEESRLINFIDDIQDAAAANGYPVVWLTEEETE